MKNVATILIVLCLVGFAQAADVTFWGLAQQDLDSRNNAVTARIGFQVEDIEPFIGSTWWPNYDQKIEQIPTTNGHLEWGEIISPPQVFSVGCIYPWMNLIAPNNPIPWIPDILIELVPEGMIANPYFGGQATVNIDKDGIFADGIVGLLIQTEEKSKTSLVTELNYPDFGGQLSVLPDKWYLNLGFRIRF